MLDYYEILGVAPDANPITIRSAFRRLAMEYHPDRDFEPSAQHKMKLLNEAHKVLSDPLRRSHYDTKRQKRQVEDQRRQVAQAEEECRRREQAEQKRCRDAAEAEERAKARPQSQCTFFQSMWQSIRVVGASGFVAILLVIWMSRATSLATALATVALAAVALATVALATVALAAVLTVVALAGVALISAGDGRGAISELGAGWRYALRLMLVGLRDHFGVVLFLVVSIAVNLAKPWVLARWPEQLICLLALVGIKVSFWLYSRRGEGRHEFKARSQPQPERTHTSFRWLPLLCALGATAFVVVLLVLLIVWLFVISRSTVVVKLDQPGVRLLLNDEPISVQPDQQSVTIPWLLPAALPMRR